MEAKVKSVLDFLREERRLCVPIYQRKYAWTNQQRLQLWNDIVRTGRRKDGTGHFIGSLVIVTEGARNSDGTPNVIIDGQQRLTTATLLLAALAESVDGGAAADGFGGEDIRKCLLNEGERGSRRFKLVLSDSDRNSLFSVLERSDGVGDSPAIREGFDFFRDRVRRQGNLSVVWKGLSSLLVVEIDVDGGDDPQLIFESLNSTGLSLSQADLIRNYLLMKLPVEDQQDLYERIWRRMELLFEQEHRMDRLDGFIRHYLAMKNHRFPPKSNFYADFKDHAEKAESVESLLRDLLHHAIHYARMAFGKEETPELRQAFADLEELRVDVAYPLLLDWYEDQEKGAWSKKDMLSAIRLLESYVVRRKVCGIPANSHDAIMVNLPRITNKERYLESVMANFQLLDGVRRFPEDEEFAREIQVRDLYHTTLQPYWLLRMERHYNRESAVAKGRCSVEHIMPQNPNLSDAWKEELGADRWMRVQRQWLHTLGNLTLTGYNSELGDRPFQEKKKVGYEKSGLQLNMGRRIGIADLDHWNEETIRERARVLAEDAVLIWAHPGLDEKTLAPYRPKPRTSSSYTLEDFDFVRDPSMLALFEALEKEVLALGPSVKRWIYSSGLSYRVRVNFIDVKAREKDFLLHLYLRYEDADDPKGQCTYAPISWLKDDDIGVHVTLSKVEDLPDVMKLVRQSYKARM